MDLNFIPLIPLWLIIAGFVLAVIAAIFGVILIFNRHRTRTASLISFALRLGALTALAFFALQPYTERETTRVGDRPIAILLDVSDSMSLDDGSGKGITRLERGIELTFDIREIVEEAGGEAVIFGFADGVTTLTTNIKPDDIPKKIGRNTTDLGEALRGISDPAAAVVISDGVFDTAGGASFPVYFVNVTSGPAPDGCWIYSAVAPSRVLPGSRFPIDIAYRSTSDEAVRFEVYDGDKKVAAGNGPGNPGPNRSTLYVTEDEPGRRFYRVAGSPGASEAYTTTEVVRGPINVTYIAHNIDYDTAYLRRAISSNRAVELSYYPATGENADNAVGTLAGSDVIVLANPSAKHLDNRLAAEIEERVADGAGLLLLLSAAQPDRRAMETGALKSLMPLSGGDPRTPLAGGTPKALPSSPTGRFGSGSVPTFTHLWDMGYPKPASETVWVLNGVPVLSTMRYGEGRVMLLAGGGFYRWENARADDAPGLAQITADLLLRLSESAKDGVTLSNYIVETGGSVTISTTTPEEPAFIITGPYDIPVQISPLEIEPGLWKAEFSPEAVGEYDLTVRRFSGDGLSVEKEHILAVEPLREKRAGFPDIDAMRSLGSGYFTGSELPELQGELEKALLATGPETTQTQNAPLLPNWIALGLFIVLLLSEWTLRRLLGLA